jgi:hypothetical protein
MTRSFMESWDFVDDRLRLGLTGTTAGSALSFLVREVARRGNLL